jgi:hypothetical protein
MTPDTIRTLETIDQMAGRPSRGRFPAGAYFLFSVNWISG